MHKTQPLVTGIAAPGASYPAKVARHVAVVDDEPDVRTLLSHVLQSGGLAVRAYESAERLLQDREDVQFGCLIADIQLPGMSGLELQSRLRHCASDMPIVIISGCATVRDAIQAFRECADAVFEKPFDAGELLDTVSRLLDAWTDGQTRRREIQRKLAALSQREVDVLASLVRGDKTAQIAKELQISSSTVEKHRLRIYEKTGVDSVVRLLHWLGGRPWHEELLGELDRISARRSASSCELN